MSNSWQPHEPQYVRPPYPSPTPRVYPNSCPLSWWCHPMRWDAISCSVVPFSSCLQFFPASGSFPMSQLFTSGGQNIGASASASVLPMNIQGWFPLGLTGLISLQSKGLPRVFSNTTVQKHQSFGTIANVDIYHLVSLCRASQVVPVVKNLPASAGDVGDMGSVPGSWRSPGGGGHGNLL